MYRFLILSLWYPCFILPRLFVLVCSLVSLNLAVYQRWLIFSYRVSVALRTALCQFCTNVPLTGCIVVLFRHLRVVRQLNSLRLQQRLLFSSRCYHRGNQQTRDGAKAWSWPAGTNQREVSWLFLSFFNGKLLSGAFAYWRLVVKHPLPFSKIKYT